jgi:hypothetical protein
MLSALLAGVVIAVASLLLGAAIMVAAGRPRHSAAGPAVGLSALLVVCGVAVKLPGHGVTAAVATGLALVAAVVVLARSRTPVGSIRVGAIVAAVGAAAVIAIPFAANGRIGILGQGLVNDDMASHLLFAEWVDTREGPTPDLVEDGYPLGPHAVVSAATKVTGADLIEGFAGLTGALAVLAALTAYGALRGVRDPLRAPAAVLAAAPYLSAAYFAQGAFKEPMLALALLGFALSLPALRGNWTWRAGIPAGVIAAGTIYNYSFPGLAWLFGTAVVWALILAYRQRSERGGLDLGRRLRSARPAVLAAIGVTILAALPETLKLVQFASFEAFSPSGEGGNTGFGNLRQPLNPLEALGIWPSAEFRITPARASTPAAAFWLGGLLALAAFAWGLGRALARREAALPAAVAAGAIGYLGAVAAGTAYTSAKALAIVAPVATVITLRGLLSADSLEGEEETEAEWWPPRIVRPLIRFGVPALTIAFVAAAALSSLLPLRQAAVGPADNAEALMEMRELVDGEDLLFLGRDNFISWELIGAEIYAPIVNHYDTEEVPSLYRATPTNGKFDWDNVPVEVLDDFDWVLTTTADFSSLRPPEQFALARHSRDFALWRRVGLDDAEGPVPGPELHERRTLVEELDPGKTLDCSDPGQAKASAVPGTATVFPVEPVVGRGWEPSSEITDSQGATQELLLGPGRWKLSLQYANTQDLHLSAPGFGLDTSFRPNLLFRGPSPYYPVGYLRVPGERGDPPSRVRITASVERPPLVGRLLGTESRAYLGTIAATFQGKSGPRANLITSALDAPGPVATFRERVPLSEACDRYLDFYAVEPDTPQEALTGIPAPTVQQPDDQYPLAREKPED